MGRSSETPVQKRKTLIRRRPSDFGSGGLIVMQAGSCTACACCCCCCLHWIGAGIGGTWGIVAASVREKRRQDSPIHPAAKRYVVWAACLGVLGTLALVTVAGIASAHFTGGHGPIRDTIQDATTAVVLTLAFVPSLAALPIGAAAMLGAAWAKRKGARVADPDEHQRMGAGMRLAWRIAWMSFVWSTFLSGVGYLLMYAYALFLD